MRSNRVRFGFYRLKRTFSPTHNFHCIFSDSSRRLGAALDHSRVLFEQQNVTNKGDGNRKIIVIVSTGNSDDDALSAAEKLKEAGNMQNEGELNMNKIILKIPRPFRKMERSNR